ncbi:MAG TPA: hypothetical protein DCQ31_18425, partial [Bacteroidales bacterium]|nr:hypothetical protein [Bacteroidales bacterium]
AVMITANRSVITSVSHWVNQAIGNDTAYIATAAGMRTFTVQAGAYSINLHIAVVAEEHPRTWVQITEIIQPTCAGSNDAELVINYPATMQALTVNGSLVAINDTIKSLAQGNSVLVFTDNRLCDLTITQEIKPSGNPCFSSSDFFSPNADGLNDLWMPKVPTGSQVIFTVFSYRNLNMQPIAKRKITEGTDSWNGTELNTGTDAPAGYYLIIGTINYPTALNWQVASFREIVKLVR